MKVDRFMFYGVNGGEFAWRIHEFGNWVRIGDYEKLEAENERLRAALTKIKGMKSEPIGDTGFSTGPLALFHAVQRTAEAALKEGR